MNLGEKIRGIRVIKGLSQQNMADILEMSLRGYGDIERGSTDIPFSRLEQIAKNLGVQVSDIIAYGDRVSIFFDQCSGNANVGINNGTVNSYETREIQHRLEKAFLENEKLKAEKEKAELEAKYWREKYKND